MLIPMGFLAASGAGGADFELIATAYGTGSSSIITFNGVPSTYKHLQLRMAVRSAYGSSMTNIGFRFNGDSAGNYHAHELVGGTTPTSTSYIGYSYAVAAFTDGNSATGGSYGAVITDILDYTSPVKNTTIRTMSGTYNGSNPRVGLRSGLWLNTAPVTSIQVVEGNGSNFTTATRVSLYGIRG